MKSRLPKPLDYRSTIRFHGHNGPFLALGYRFGEFLVKKHRPTGIMDFKITVRTRLKKPYTCLIDGLQCSTFATTGKGNLIVKSYPRDILVTVKKSGKEYRYAIRKEALRICLGADDLKRSADQILKTSAGKLWKRIV
jgi:formylmethanofuran dehydrogenase subunit E